MSAMTVPAVSVLHSPRDEALGEKIAKALLREGHKTRCLGEDPLSGDLLLEDGAAIVIWSSATAKLARLHEQAREALERGALIPVTVGGAHAPEGFEALPAVDLSGWGGDDNDPRWCFVLEEINLAIQRWQTEDGAVWSEAEGQPLPAADELQTAEADRAAEEDRLPENLRQHNLEQESPDGKALPTNDQTPEDIDPIQDDIFYGTLTLDEPINVEASYQLSADGYWPDAAAVPKRPFRFGAMPVVITGGLGLVAATLAAIVLAPTLLSSPSPMAATSNPDMLRDSFGTVAFVQPITPVEGETTGLKAQSDFVVTSYHEDAEQRAAGAVLAEPVRLEPAIEGLASNSGVGVTAVTEAGFDDVGGVISFSDDTVAPEDIIEQNPLEGNFTDCAACPKMATLSAGSFQFGSPVTEVTRQEDEGPVVDITLAQSFAIAVSEVTYDEWDACFAERGCREYKPSDLGWGRGSHPVANVSYEDAQSYVRWLSTKTGKAYRLPSEAEWEYAARGGGDTVFGLGKDVSPSQANYNGNYPFLGEVGEFRGRTTPVASFAPNAFGLYDMHGNLWEWTADCWNDSHSIAPVDGTPVALAACGSRVLKGGAWNTGGWRLRSAHRINKRAGARENDIGFRVARDMD